MELLLDITGKQSDPQRRLALLTLKCMLPLHPNDLRRLCYSTEHVSIERGDRRKGFGLVASKTISTVPERLRFLDLVAEVVEHSHQDFYTIEIIVPLLTISSRDRICGLAQKAHTTLDQYFEKGRRLTFKIPNPSSMVYFHEDHEPACREETKLVERVFRAIHEEALKSSSDVPTSLCSRASIFICQLLKQRWMLRDLAKVSAVTRKEHERLELDINSCFWADFVTWTASPEAHDEEIE